MNMYMLVFFWRVSNSVNDLTRVQHKQPIDRRGIIEG
jgi:hypothetical protein